MLAEVEGTMDDNTGMAVEVNGLACVTTALDALREMADEWGWLPESFTPANVRRFYGISEDDAPAFCEYAKGRTATRETAGL